MWVPAWPMRAGARRPTDGTGPSLPTSFRLFARRLGRTCRPRWTLDSVDDAFKEFFRRVKRSDEAGFLRLRS